MPHSRWPAIGEGCYVRQSDGADEHGHVRVRISPRPPGSGLLFTNEIAPGAISNACLRGTEQGLRAVVGFLIDGGLLVADVEIELVDGSDDGYSSDRAFMIAAGMAFRDAVDNAGLISGTSGDDLAAPVREPRHPRPVPRDSAVALPEPDNDRGR